ncbi:MAG: hypothetical protein K9J75_08940 [Cyanobium usitatum Tobar12.5m-G36]|nr:hypothetical protein [Cyanobium usitatum Tobar12.5m-G36]
MAQYLIVELLTYLAGAAALGEGLVEEGGEFLQLVVVQHPITLAILGDVLGFQHPAVLSLFKNEVGGLVTGHGSSR